MTIYLSIAVLSAATLAYEVLLLRLFAIAQWHHFAYMAISIALLGFGAAGVYVQLRPKAFSPDREVDALSLSEYPELVEQNELEA